MGKVADRIAARIVGAGPLSFAEVMEEALYGPGGYYARPTLAIGPDGDYVTGSALSSVFGHTTARVVARVADEVGGRADYLEVAYGNGEHLAAVTERLTSLAGTRILAWDRVARDVPADVTLIGGLADLGALGFVGLIFSYELFDALPVHRLIGRPHGVGELWVDWSEAEGFRYLPGDLSDPRLVDLLGGHPLEVGQVADLAPGWRPLYRQLAQALGRGLLVTCDYGYERAALLDPRVRRSGTVACYSRHRAHRDALRRLGEDDLTAHVDWTALVEEGEAAGLETVAFTRQARWLTAAGFFEEAMAGGGRISGEARVLLDGGGMGEEIRVLVQARGVDPARVLDLDILGAWHPSSP